MNQNPEKERDVWLYLQMMLWKLITKTEVYVEAVKSRIIQIASGRDGQNHQTSRLIYLMNLFRTDNNKIYKSKTFGLYIRRVGKLAMNRKLIIGQERQNFNER